MSASWLSGSAMALKRAGEGDKGGRKSLAVLAAVPIRRQLSPAQWILFAGQQGSLPVLAVTAHPT
jgi:hypothetical protein